MSEDRMNPAFQRMLQYFQYDHLQGKLRAVSSEFSAFAHDMIARVSESDNPAEVTVGLRKLLEAKDCFVRAVITHAIEETTPSTVNLKSENVDVTVKQWDNVY